MKLSHRIVMTGLPLAGTSLFAAPAAAAGIDLTVTIPRLTVAEYHRPYVAIWIEPKAGGSARTLALWYDHDMKANEGTKWLRDVRTWWRASGRALKFPADGITGATRAPGAQKISFVAGQGPFGTLAPGDYVLKVEAAREVGGREILSLPFAWPPKGNQTVSAAGKAELGTVTAVIKR